MNYHPTIGALCGKLEMTRQNYYQGCKARRKGAIDSRHVEELVTRERRLQPRLGGGNCCTYSLPNWRKTA